MGLNCGIVGLPNVGKSTLFNILVQASSAETANYPFCTIEPNVGRVPVPDSRLSTLAKICSSKSILPTYLEFVDIAGLVKGASKGEGLGNKFLSHIREVDAIAHVLRCFEDENITHVEGSVSPIRDLEIIEMELILSDIESLDKRLSNIEKKAKSSDKDSMKMLELVKKLLELLNAGKPARELELSENEQIYIKDLQLITTKPILYICNVSEGDVLSGNSHSNEVMLYAKEKNSPCIIISAKIEEDISNLENIEEKQEFLESLGLEEPSLNKVIKSGYEILNLITFFTVGPKEARAWTVRNGATAPQSSGVIHTDFEKGFIRAETISYDDYISCNGEQGAKDSGKMRLEGKDYKTIDGDIFHFRFNV